MLHTYILHTVKGFIKTLFNEYTMCFDHTHPLHFLPTLLLFLVSSPNRVTSIPTFYIHSGYYVSVENVRSTNERKHEVFLNLARTWVKGRLQLSGLLCPSYPSDARLSTP